MEGRIKFQASECVAAPGNAHRLCSEIFEVQPHGRRKFLPTKELDPATVGGNIDHPDVKSVIAMLPQGSSHLERKARHSPALDLTFANCHSSGPWLS
jgi:hypothetical protein